MIQMRRLVGWFMLLSVSVYTVRMAFGTPPATDPERKARVEEMYATYAKGFPSVAAWTADDLKRHLGDEDLVLVDVREPQERAVSIIPGAISSEEFEKDPSAFEGRKIVAYCTIGYRSGLWVIEQRAKGVDAINLAGSLLSWTHAGGALVRNGEPTHDVHVYGARWNLAANAYRGIW